MLEHVSLREHVTIEMLGVFYGIRIHTSTCNQITSTFSAITSITSACFYTSVQQLSSLRPQSGLCLYPSERDFNVVPLVPEVAFLRTKTSVHSPLLSSSRAQALSAASIIIRGEDDFSHALLHVQRCPHRWVNMHVLKWRKRARTHTHPHTFLSISQLVRCKEWQNCNHQVMMVEERGDESRRREGSRGERRRGEKGGGRRGDVGRGELSQGPSEQHGGWDGSGLQSLNERLSPPGVWWILPLLHIHTVLLDSSSLHANHLAHAI